MGDVTLKFTGDSKQLEKALKRLQAETDKLTKENKELKSTSKAAAQESKKFLGTARKGAMVAAGAFLQTAGGVASATSAIGLLRGEYDRLIERQKLAADKQTTFAQSFRQAAFNLGDDKEIKTGAQLKGLIDEIVSKTESTPTVVARVLSDALSARGNKTAREAAEAVVATLQIAPDMEESAPLLAGTALDTGKAAGLSPKQAIGFALALGSKARVTNMQALSEHVAPGANQLLQFGGDIQGAGALMATLTQGIQDTSGRTSRTTAIALAKQLEDFLPNLDSTEERLKAVQNDPALQKGFFKGAKFDESNADGPVNFRGATFEKKAFATVRELITGGDGSSLIQNYNQTLEDLRATDFEKVFETKREIGDSVASSKTASLGRRFDKNIEKAQLAADVDGRSGVVREKLDEFLRAQGVDGITHLGFDAADMPGTMLGSDRGVDFAIQRLQRMRDSREQGFGANVTSDFMNTIRAAPQLFNFSNPDAFDEEVEALGKKDAAGPAELAAFDDMISELKAMKVELEKLNANAGKNNRRGVVKNAAKNAGAN